jgi:hypothetical protein
MKPVTAKYTFTGSNAWGATSTSERQAFEVEASDVGTTREHYLGFNHRSYKFTHADVGRKIEHIYGGKHPYACWAFCTDEWVARYALATNTVPTDDVTDYQKYLNSKKDQKE